MQDTSSPEPVSLRRLVRDDSNHNDVEACDIANWHIHYLRRKIEPDPDHPHYIKIIRYKGYLWSAK